MAVAVSVQNMHVPLGNLSAEECCGGASSLRTRTTASFRSLGSRPWEWRNKGLASKLTFQASVGERDIQFGRFSCRRRVRVNALLEKHSIFSALTSRDDSSLTQFSSVDANNGTCGEIELNYTTVKEIVENLQEAPFLQYVYFANQGGKPARQSLSAELFEKPDTWGPVRKCLLDAAPDGIIMVHRLDRNNPSECCLIEKSSEKIGVNTARGEQDGSGGLEDYWGLLVHGCRVRCNACYLLRTTRQPTSNGFTTYFMLIRAECFGPSIEKQFQRASLA